MFTKIKSLDKYLELIGATKENIDAIWEQGSFLEGLHDEFSDRDFAVIWEDDIPSADKRLKVAQKLKFDIHEIKDVTSIGQSFDMFSDGESLFNIGHGTKVKETKWYEAICGEKLPSDLEAVLMSMTALEKGRVYYQKDAWVDRLLEKIKLTTKIKDKIINYYSNKVSIDLKLLQKSSSRNDLLQFIKYLHKILRNLQLIYLLKNDKPIISEKFFDERFTRMENGEITKLIKRISSQIDMNTIYADALTVASGFEIEQSEKFKA